MGFAPELGVRLGNWICRNRRREGKMEGGLDGKILYACMKFSNSNKNLKEKRNQKNI